MNKKVSNSLGHRLMRVIQTGTLYRTVEDFKLAPSENKRLFQVHSPKPQSMVTMMIIVPTILIWESPITFRFTKEKA